MQNDDNRRQSWTIVDKYLKPPFAKPPFRLSQFLQDFWRFGSVNADIASDCAIVRFCCAKVKPDEVLSKDDIGP